MKKKVSKKTSKKKIKTLKTPKKRIKGLSKKMIQNFLDRIAAI